MFLSDEKAPREIPEALFVAVDVVITLLVLLLVQMPFA
jgi:hypothetical protein